MKYEKNPVATAAKHLYEIVDSTEMSAYTEKLRESVQTVEEAFKRYKYMYINKISYKNLQ